MSPIATHTHCWPLFITVLPPAFELAELNTYIAEVNELYKRQQRFATLVDTSLVTGIPSASQRKHLADWQIATVDHIRRYNVCTALVIRSAAVRGGITAINWLFRPPTEQIIVGSFEEGFARAIEKLTADGQKIPEAVARQARTSPPRRVEDTLPTRQASRG
jgi:hypothetical protein